MQEFTYHLHVFELWLDRISVHRQHLFQQEPKSCIQSTFSIHPTRFRLCSMLWQWPHCPTVQPPQRTLCNRLFVHWIAQLVVVATKSQLLLHLWLQPIYCEVVLRVLRLLLGISFIQNIRDNFENKLKTKKNNWV